jgi:ferritin-like metal-binding protein YciE
MPESMETTRELFVHELGDILFAEQTIVKMLPKLKSEATDRALSKGFEKHLAESQKHVENVKAAFKAIGEPAKAEKCPGIEGLKKEHDEFMTQEKPTDAVCDMFLTGAAARTEHYEIAAYTGLVGLAKALGETEAEKLLSDNRVDRQARRQGSRQGDGVAARTPRG